MGKKINTWVFITNPNQTRLSPPFWRQVNVVCCACNNILCVQQCQFKNLDALAIMHSIFSNLLTGWAYSGNFISIMWFLLESISIFSLGKNEVPLGYSRLWLSLHIWETKVIRPLQAIEQAITEVIGARVGHTCVVCLYNVTFCSYMCIVAELVSTVCWAHCSRCQQGWTQHFIGEVHLIVASVW